MSNTISDTDQHRYHVDDSNTVTITLRLLRLIVKHAGGLQEVLEEGLRITPIKPWKVIIPQLFSRLNHHEAYVRKSLSELLCRLAQDRPQLVIFPAIVGANRELNDFANTKTLDENQSSTQLSNCFGSLLNCLSAISPQMVMQVQMLIKELRRVCLLWDEFWIYSLTQIYSNYVARVNAINSEFNLSDDTLKESKFNNFRKHLVNDFERVAAFTARSPETDYEKMFKRRFQKQIQETLESLRTQKFSVAWEQLKLLFHVIQQNPIRGNNVSLKMHSLSPVLARMSKTRISMPGVDQYEKETIYINAVDPHVYILPTKTKPKKVAFYGNNGHKFTYLFKSFEDLHLDERIMQFLSISNSIMVTKNGVNMTANNNYSAQFYSVIPLGPQSGLISWVEGVTPIFSLYKKWQKREVIVKQNSKDRKGSESNIAAPIKLIDLYHSKLAPLLAKHNLTVNDNRKLWPMSALREALDELIKDTPKDLLSRELWCHSVNATEWRRSVRRYTNSLSVMSVIGYVIGLGDRHLDNMLINLESGEIVHIDYNVCFDKGKTLRIPEKVPFRMTQNLMHSLGITGVEGAFRLGCEYVLKALRKERETLLTLLEAFVYDPLVDWTINEDNPGNRRVNIPKAASLNLSSSCHPSPKHTENKNISKLEDWEAIRKTICGKLYEVINLWPDYKLLVVKELNNITEELNCIMNLNDERRNLCNKQNELTQQFELIHEIESLNGALSTHSFNTARKRYSAKQASERALQNILPIMQTVYTKVKTMIDVYHDCVQGNRSTILTRLSDELAIRKKVNNDWHSEYQFLADVLKQHISETQTFHLYENARSNLNAMLCRANELALECVQQLQQYASIMVFYAKYYFKRNPFVIFEQSYNNYVLSAKPIEVKIFDIEKPPPEHIRAIGEKLEQISLEINSDLQHSNFNLESKLNERLSIDTALKTLENYRIMVDPSQQKLMLYSALYKTITKANEAFFIYEKTAISIEDTNILEQQISFLKIVQTMFQTILHENDKNSCIKLKLFNELKNILNCLALLKEMIQINLAEYVYQIYLKYDYDDKFALYMQNIDYFYESYKEYIVSSHESLHNENCKIFEALKAICGTYDEFRESLTRLVATTQQLIEHMPDNDYKNNIQANIKTPNENELSSVSIFYVIHESLSMDDCCDVRSLAKPINNFINCMEKKYFCGLTSLYVHELCTSLNKTLDNGIDCNTEFTTEPENLCESLFIALQHDIVLQQQQNQISVLKKWKHIHFAATTAFYWLNDEILGQNFSSHILSKNRLFSTVFGSACTLQTIVYHAEALQAEISSYVHKIEQQKSNWNRTHIESFMRNDIVQCEKITTLLQFINEVVECAENVRVFECYEVQNDSESLNLLENIKMWNNYYDVWVQSSRAINEIEVALIDLLKPEGSIDNEWLKNINGLLNKKSSMLQQQINAIEHQKTEKVKCINNFPENNLLDKTCFEIQSLISVEIKNERNIKSGPGDVLELISYCHDINYKLKQFSMELSTLLQKFNLSQSITYTDEHCKDLITMIKKVLEEKSADINEYFNRTKEFLKNYTNKILTNSSAPNKKVYYEQKRNTYGVSVWKKIRMKLEGRDPELNQRSGVQEQIDFIIKEATNKDHLAMLYEGWTPWV